MTDENNRDTPSNRPDNDPISQPQIETPPQKGEMGKKGNTATDGNQNPAKELAREFRWVEFAQIGSNVVLAIVGIIALCIYNGQLGAMKGQLEQMQGSSKQTDQLICLYRQQVNKLGEQVAKLDASIGATNRLADEAKRSADTAHQVFLFSNRPYVGMLAMPISEDSKTHLVTIHAIIKNFGSVPGTNFVWKWRPYGIDFPDRGKVPDRPDIIFPGQELSLKADVSPASWADIAQGNKVMRFDIWAEYDGPSKKHYTYCTTTEFIPTLGEFGNLGPVGPMCNR